MGNALQGISVEQRAELQRFLERLVALMSELAAAAKQGDDAALQRIRGEIDFYRKKVEAIRRSGTIGSA